MKLHPLRPGDVIALVAPSSHFDTDRFRQSRQHLEKSGFQVICGRHLFCRTRYLAGSEAERTEDLVWAFTEPTVKAVLAVRGGYGSSRLLSSLPLARIAEHPKIFMGYSDITFLHLALRNHTPWATFHGPNLMDLNGTEDRWHGARRALAGEDPFSWSLESARILRHGKAQGRVIGGNLTCLAHLLGTPFFPPTDGALLLIEDCREALYRLDRLLTQLRLAGVLEGLGGLLLGQFTDCGDIEAILSMVADLLAPHSFPVVANLPFGHGHENQVIPLGIPFELDTFQGTLKALEHPFA